MICGEIRFFLEMLEYLFEMGWHRCKKKKIIQKYVPPPIANIVVAAQSFFIRSLTNLFSDKLFSQDKVYLKIFILQQKTKYWLQNLHSCYLHSRVGW
jgi:hypothetical protein